MSEENEVKLAGKSVRLCTPKSVVARQQAVIASGKNVMISLGVAIGVCWPQLPRLKTKIADHGYDYLAYGHAVLDELYDAGATLDEVTKAGNLALGICVTNSKMILEPDVTEEEDFLEQSEETTL